MLAKDPFEPRSSVSVRDGLVRITREYVRQDCAAFVAVVKGYKAASELACAERERRDLGLPSLLRTHAPELPVPSAASQQLSQPTPQTFPLQQPFLLLPTQPLQSAMQSVLTAASDSDSEGELATDFSLSEEDKRLRQALEEESLRLWREQVLEVASGFASRRLREVW